MSAADVSLPPTWWTRRRAVIAAAAAAAVGACAFLYRFNTLGGSLGGFDNDHFVRLARADMLLQGQQPLRDFVDAELRGAWPALTYASSAWAQQAFGRTLLSEAYLMAILMTIAYVIVFLVALDLSKRWSFATLATAVAIATTPKLHNYPKVLMLAAGVWTLRAAVMKPSVPRLGAAALVTAAATLFRHDYGVYVAVGIIVALVARDIERWPVAARTVGIYTALTAACLVPSAIWVQTYGGIPGYLRNALVTVAAERTRTPLDLPPFDLSSLLASEGMELVSYYAFWAVPLVAGAALVALLRGSKGHGLSTHERATAIGLLAMAVVVNRFFLRANLAARFGDAVVPVVLLAAWVVGAAAASRSAAFRIPMTIAPVALLVPMFGAAYVYSEVGHELDTSGLSDSWAKTVRRFHAVNEDLGRLPPAVWSDEDATGMLVAARYIAECTSPSDHLLALGPIHEIPVYARRLFAAGQAPFKLSLYLSEADQRRAVARIERQSVPIVLADAADFEDGFASDYPLVARYVAEHYVEASPILVEGEPRLRVFVETRRKPVRMDPHLGLPCFR